MLNAGVNPFVHYLTHGVNEGRAPNASFPKLGDGFDADAYLAANSDLGEAGIDTPEAAYAHFVMHGQFENRPGAPVVDTNPGDTFTLTNALNTQTGGVDNIEGTDDNDVINTWTTASLNSWDVIDGGDGRDTLNISQGAIGDTDFLGGVWAGNTAAPTIRNVEVINNADVIAGQGFNGPTLDLANVTGVREIWTQYGNAANEAVALYTNASLDTV